MGIRRSIRRGRVELTVRDERLLRAVGRFRACRSSDLRSLFFPCRLDTMLHRLGQLRRAGYLAATSRSRTEEHIWHIGAQGRSWLRTQGIEAGSLPRSPGLEHHLGIVSCWVALAVAAHYDHPRCSIRSAVPDWERRGQTAGLAPGIVPDLLMEIESPMGRHTLALEVDRGSEPLAIIRAKLNQYALALVIPGFARSSSFTLVVVLMGVGSGRAHSIERLLAESWTHRSFVAASGPRGLGRILDALAVTPQPTPPTVWGASGPSTQAVSTPLASVEDGP